LITQFHQFDHLRDRIRRFISNWPIKTSLQANIVADLLRKERIFFDIAFDVLFKNGCDIISFSNSCFSNANEWNFGTLEIHNDLVLYLKDTLLAARDFPGLRNKFLKFLIGALSFTNSSNRSSDCQKIAQEIMRIFNSPDLVNSHVLLLYIKLAPKLKSSPDELVLISISKY
jgi:hypothetical protein